MYFVIDISLTIMCEDKAIDGKYELDTLIQTTIPSDSSSALTAMSNTA
jgi:hypothetical protein